MTASNSKVMGGDKNLNKTTAETRRASKPLMEKRRRARINQSLAVLKSLIVDSQRVEGQKHSKLEKADILEMTVSHLQSVKKSDEQKFMEGFEECLSESMKFLEKSKINPSVVDKLADHLKHFQDTVDPGSILKQNPSSASSTASNPPSSNEDGSSRLLSLSMNVGDQGDSEFSSKFSLNVPRFKIESTKPNGSSQSHTSCLSPSLSVSNDSNNNNFMNEMEEGFQSVSPSPSLGQGNQGQLELIPPHQTLQISPSSNFSQNQSITESTLTEEPYVLNLSTNPSSHYINLTPMNTVSYPQVELMDNCSEPLDFSKPLNLSKYPVGYRLSEDGVWRPW